MQTTSILFFFTFFTSITSFLFYFLVVDATPPPRLDCGTEDYYRLTEQFIEHFNE